MGRAPKPVPPCAISNERKRNGVRMKIIAVSRWRFLRRLLYASVEAPFPCTEPTISHPRCTARAGGERQQWKRGGKFLCAPVLVTPWRPRLCLRRRAAPGGRLAFLASTARKSAEVDATPPAQLSRAGLPLPTSRCLDLDSLWSVQGRCATAHPTTLAPPFLGSAPCASVFWVKARPFWGRHLPHDGALATLASW